jgi:hypothetical protein
MTQNDNFNPYGMQGGRRIDPVGNSPMALIGAPMDTGNPGNRLLSNDESITEMLKGLNFNDENQAARCSAALGENEIFLYNYTEDGRNQKINAEVDRIRSRIKYRATSQCSVKGQWVDQYKQTAIGVATSTSGRNGWQPLQMPNFPKHEEPNDNRNFNKNRKP